MHTDKNLQFITNKVLETNIALMYCYSDSLPKLPNSIAETCKVDTNGLIWVFVTRPGQLVSQLEQEFATNLNYFKKGNSYSLRIFGKARIVANKEELSCLNLTSAEMDRATTTQVLVCVKILKAEYFDYGTADGNNYWLKIKSYFSSLFDWAKPGSTSLDYNPSAGLQHYGF